MLTETQKQALIDAGEFRRFPRGGCHMWAQKLTMDQPGYRRGENMRFAKSAVGGVRLYVDIAGRWMDGSLQDL